VTHAPPGGVHEILAALEALGVRVSLSDVDRIELRGTQAPTELRRALMQHGAQLAAQGCVEHMGFRDKPCRRCGRSWGVHYPWVKVPLPTLQQLRPKRAKPVRGKHVPGNEKPGPVPTAS
jgi:hypothetical protein